jgi:hypothetical protein
MIPPRNTVKARNTSCQKHRLPSQTPHDKRTQGPFEEVRMPKHTRPRPAAHAVRIALVLLSAAASLFPSAASATPVPPPANNSAPSGLVVVIENKPQQAQLNLQALNNPLISGVALQIRWRDIEAVQGKPDWSKLDQLFAAAESSHKWVQLLIFPGFWSPPWALEGAQTLTLPIQYGPGKGTLEKLPLPWDRVYLNHWFDFLKQLSAKYGNSPAFRVAAAAGPTSVSAEFTLPHKPEEMQEWRRVGYTASKYIEAWQQVFEVYAADFPNQYVSLSMGFGMNIDDLGKKDARAGKPTKEAIIDEGIRIFGRRFVLQNSNLDGYPEPERGVHGIPLLISYNGHIITGFQLRTSCLRNSGNMGAEGDPPLALRKCIDRGTLPNASGHRINYLEIYEPDVLAPEMQPVLHYGASLFQ